MTNCCSCFSEHSMNSEWVRPRFESEKAELKEKRRKLFPIRLVDLKPFATGSASTLITARTWASRSGVLHSRLP